MGRKSENLKKKKTKTKKKRKKEERKKKLQHPDFARPPTSNYEGKPSSDIAPLRGTVGIHRAHRIV